MKKIIVLISLIFCSSLAMQAAIPITVAGTPKTEQKARPKKESKLKKIVQKLTDVPSQASSETSIFNTLSLTCGILGILLTAATGIGGIPFMIAAIVLGIIGLTRGEKHRGMGIAGIILGGGLLLLIALAVALFVSLLGGW